MAQVNRSAAAALAAAAVAIPFGVAAAVAVTGTTPTGTTPTGTTSTSTNTTPTGTTSTSTTPASTTPTSTTAPTPTGTPTAVTTGAPGAATTESTGTSTTQTTPTPSTTPTRIAATLTPGQERPVPIGARAAKGSFVGTVTDAGKLTYRLTFGALTGKAIAVHIHSGKRGAAGPVVVTLCARNCAPRTGTVSVKKRVVDRLRAGTAYVNVHTKRNPAGEIRGQIRNR
jgi:hypothetical protein